MRIVHWPGDLESAVESAQSEAEKAFGDPAIFLEKYIAGARHIEFQVFGDAHGNVVQLFERECSTQRRHQKIIEETPSPLVDEALRKRMGETAVAAARAVSYHNAGTIEFIVNPQTREFYFLEMNTRLQVEHPITEMITGLDLVELQIEVALGKPLPINTGDPLWSPVSSRGHAMECRVYAEDAAHGFLPATGHVLTAVFPSAPGVRIDTGIEAGDEVSLHYDPMLAKIIVLGQDRADAIRKMDWALAHTVILGVTTNIRFLRDVLAHPVFLRGEVTTDFVEKEFAEWKPRVSDQTDLALIAAALSEGMRDEDRFVGMKEVGGERQRDRRDPWQAGDSFRVGGT